MPEIAATKDTASMTQAAPHAIMPHGGQNRRAARVQAAALRWLVRLAALLTAAVLCGPAATPGTVALAAVPSAVLLPFMFVRIHRAIALPLYLLLLAAAVISTVLQ